MVPALKRGSEEQWIAEEDWGIAVLHFHILELGMGIWMIFSARVPSWILILSTLFECSFTPGRVGHTVIIAIFGCSITFSILLLFFNQFHYFLFAVQTF